MSRKTIIIKHTIVFPTRSAATSIANIVVIPIWADMESVYSDMILFLDCLLN